MLTWPQGLGGPQDHQGMNAKMYMKENTEVGQEFNLIQLRQNQRKETKNAGNTGSYLSDSQFSSA